MNKHDLIMIIGIAILLMASVAGFELALRGLPEVLQDIDTRSVTSSLSASATPLPQTAAPTQPAATAVATEQPDEALPATPTAGA